MIKASIQVHAGVAELCFENPPLNLVTSELLDQINEKLCLLEQDSSIRVLILHSSGERAFSAGSDMREFDRIAMNPLPEKLIPEHKMLQRIAELSFPTIAAVEGHALGGGFELAICCDLRVISRNSRIGLPEVAIGGLAAVATQRLPRLIGIAKAKQMIFLAEVLSAEGASEVGLVTQLVEPGQALFAARSMAQEIATRGPIALRLAKRLIDESLDLPIVDGLKLALDISDELFHTDDLKEGASAFLSKRKPSFKSDSTQI